MLFKAAADLSAAGDARTSLPPTGRFKSERMQVFPDTIGKAILRRGVEIGPASRGNANPILTAQSERQMAQVVAEIHEKYDFGNDIQAATIRTPARAKEVALTSATVLLAISEAMLKLPPIDRDPDMFTKDWASAPQRSSQCNFDGLCKRRKSIVTRMPDVFRLSPQGDLAFSQRQANGADSTRPQAKVECWGGVCELSPLTCYWVF